MAEVQAGLSAAVPTPSTDDEPIGLYVHVPFCARKCPYCDFNTYDGLEALHEPFVAALAREIADQGTRLTERKVATVFLGGGTPTVLSGAALERVLVAIQASFQVLDGAEITCEANPGTVDRARFAQLAALGVNRLSMGVQSFQADELAFLGRVHDVADVFRAFEAARQAGFENISLDLMFGLPSQTEAAWSASLDAALALDPEHLSLYSLIVEPNTPLYTWVETGQVPRPDDDAAATLYELALDRLAAFDYVHYEVSNWARATPARQADAAEPAWASRHNLVYWRNGEWLGVGPGAHSHLRRRSPDGGWISRRWGNVRPVPAYIRRAMAGQSTEVTAEEVAPRVAMGETMMLGLRLVREGVPFERFHRLHQADARAVFAAELAELADWGLVVVDGEGMRLSARGLAVGNQVFQRFVSNS